MKHPDKEEVIRMLNDGESVRAVEAWLKEKYPSNKNMWVTSVTLQTFRKEKEPTHRKRSLQFTLHLFENDQQKEQASKLKRIF